MRYFFSLLILLGGFGLAWLLIATGPRLEPRPPESLIPLVRTQKVEAARVQFNTTTYGTVLPRAESELIPEVAGRVLEVSPNLVTGGFFSRDEVLLRIDPLDYEVAVRQAEASVARAGSELRNALRAHERQQDLARRELASESQQDDALNRLQVARAVLSEQEARLAKAERDLERTLVRAPYDGRVRSERVDVGQFVNRGARLATIYAIDFAEVRLPVHDHELEFIQLPLTSAAAAESEPLAEVTLRAGFGGREHSWQGRVVRTEGELDARTRMVNVIAEVPAPYRPRGDRPPLNVGLFVEAEIHGQEMDGLVVLPRAALRDGDTVYVVDEESRLRFREVRVLRIGEDKVYIEAGLAPGEEVCISQPGSVLDGMTVRSEGRSGEAGAE